ncbi:class II aldolase [Deinococcus detaillensis]|uniref:Class II aldolase n=1 Tax=Deinococcus detaillensis TaxID=2592048 RepID=A0A553V6K4_9DEIO|nr:class II aldolase/adducin family protein [Deinococcus detaillensis]TSA88056.1 class II aldolase [Deinococcus detaillensis]
MPKILNELLSLSHTLGNPQHPWAILGEGNTSARLSADTFLVKASGSELRTLTEAHLSEVQFAPLLDVLSSNRPYADADIKALLTGASLTPALPSVETLLHAFLLGLPDVNFVGHTHPVSINGLTCSARGWSALQAGGRLFPDEIVVCGPAPCCVPYTDPGLWLARALRDAIEFHQQAHGVTPKTIYLQNHGFIALGKSAREVQAVTQMADKAAQILLHALACGTPTYLTPEQVARIYQRPDEHHRQKALGL